MYSFKQMRMARLALSFIFLLTSVCSGVQAQMPVIAEQKVPFAVRGMAFDFAKPMEFTFFFNQSGLSADDPIFRNACMESVRDFAVALTMPEKGIWVNLNPREASRIMPVELKGTVLGHRLLAQDYALKQLAAGLTDPQTTTGKVFWKHVYTLSAAHGISEEVSAEALSRVWIVPEKVEIFEDGERVYILNKSFKVLTDLEHEKGKVLADADKTAEAVRLALLPALRDAVNNDPAFLPLRQVFDGIILATWFKRKFRDHQAVKLLANVSSTGGLVLESRQKAEEVFTSYLSALKAGVYNFIREDVADSGEMLPRKYFAGGVMGNIPAEDLVILSRERVDPAMIPHQVAALKIRFKVESIDEPSLKRFAAIVEKARLVRADDQVIAETMGKAKGAVLDSTLTELNVKSLAVMPREVTGTAPSRQQVLTNTIASLVSKAAQRNSLLVPVIYDSSPGDAALRDDIMGEGYPRVLQGTIDAQADIQQMSMRPETSLPFIISFVNQKKITDYGLDNLLSDRLAQAFYDFYAAERGGQAAILRLEDTPENHQLVLDAFKNAKGLFEFEDRDTSLIVARDGQLYKGFVLQSGKNRAGFSDSYPTAARLKDFDWIPRETMNPPRPEMDLKGNDEVTAFFSDISHKTFTGAIGSGEREDPHVWYAHIRGTASRSRIFPGVVSVIFDPRERRVVSYAWMRPRSESFEIAEIFTFPEKGQIGLGTEAVWLAYKEFKQRFVKNALEEPYWDDRSPPTGRRISATTSIWQAVNERSFRENADSAQIQSVWQGIFLSGVSPQYGGIDLTAEYEWNVTGGGSIPLGETTVSVVPGLPFVFFPVFVSLGSEKIELK